MLAPVVLFWAVFGMPAHALSLKARSGFKAPSRVAALTPGILENLQSALTAKLQADFDQPLRLEVLTHGSALLPPSVRIEGFEIKSMSFEPHRKGFKAEVILRDSQNTSHPTAFGGRVVFLKRVPIFKKAAYPGDVICLEKLNWQSLENDQRLNTVITDPELLKGAIVKMPIAPGEMPRLKNVSTHRLIEKGDLVELVYDSPHLKINLSGARALSKGRVGETVLVSHPLSKGGQPVWGVIEPHHRVMIKGAR